VLELGGAVVSVLDRLDREDVRLLPLRRVIASAVGLRWVRRQHSPLVAMHHMILRVHRKFFEITTKPNIVSTATVPTGISSHAGSSPAPAHAAAVLTQAWVDAASSSASAQFRSR